MVLVADAGNTNIKVGVYDNEKLMMTARLVTAISKSPDSFMQDVLNILRDHDIGAAEIQAVVVSTVVPEATKAFLSGMRKLFSIEALVVNSDTKTGIEIKTEVPSETGADRLVNSSAAFHYYGGPVLVIDFGTATTYDVVTEKGEFLGGVIAPGIRICAEALWEKTEKLPRISIEDPGMVLGRNTVSSMQSGVYYGYLGQLEYFVRQLKKELAADLKVVATGGFSDIFAGKTNAVDHFDPDLTLKGLYYINHLNSPFK